MIGLRITNQLLLDTTINSLNLDQQMLETAQQKVTTGHNITQPSDDPFIASQAVLFRQRLGLNTQLQTNLNSAQGWLQATDSSLSSVDEVLQRARQLAIQGSNGTLTASDRQNTAKEIHQLLLQAVDIGNSKFGGQFLFSGTKTTIQPFVHNGSTLSPNISAGTPSPVTYNGDTGSVTRQTDQAAQLQVNVTGNSLENVFTDLTQLEYDLNNGNARVSGSVSGLNAATSLTTGSNNAVDTFAINGVSIGTRIVPAGGPLMGKQIIGFGPSTKLSQVIAQINTQSGQTGVTASLDRNGVLVLQNASQTSKPIIVSQVDQVTTDANGVDVTGGTGVPVASGGSTVHDLGLSNQIDNAIGSVDVTALDNSLDTVQALRAQIGAKTNRVQDGQTRLSSLGITLTQLDSSIEDVDMAKAISDLASRQTAFQAALGVAAKTLPPTLLDFLK